MIGEVHTVDEYDLMQAVKSHFTLFVVPRPSLGASWRRLGSNTGMAATPATMTGSLYLPTRSPTFHSRRVLNPPI